MSRTGFAALLALGLPSLALPATAWAAPPHPVVVTRTPAGTVITRPHSDPKKVCTTDANGKTTCRTGRYAEAVRARGGGCQPTVIVRRGRHH
ncbi:MAG: hypothetical protein JWP35_3020 [Caulobacter sp.]|nr:hypothetical protein [Caulobacter sp.]